jgi:hypothetical protein
MLTQNLRPRRTIFFRKSDQLFGAAIDHFIMGGEQLPDELLEQLLGAADGKLDNIGEMELALEALKVRVAQQAVDKKLRELPPEDGKPKACPRCGKPVRVSKKDVPRTFAALSGTHTVKRHYHYCRDCRVGFYPRDGELGLPSEGDVTAYLEARLCDLAVTTVYEECAERWEVHYPHQAFSPNMFQLAAERLAIRLELADVEILQRELAPSASALSRPKERLYVQNDGSMLPIVGGAWKEAKVGVLVREGNYLSHREHKRGVVQQGRYVAVLGGQESFRELMREALDVEKWGRFRETIWLGDGARGNWNLADALCPTAVKILELGHSLENGSTCGKALLGEKDPLVEDWNGRIGQLVRAGNVDTVVHELMECLPETTTDAQVKAHDSLVVYYRANQDRMRYPEFLAKGYMIGTGIVESAHRHVLQGRMKLAGQHGSEDGGRRMTRLRAAYRTAGPKRFHTAINRAACRTLVAPTKKPTLRLVA